jgi:hypothetical protein
MSQKHSRHVPFVGFWMMKTTDIPGSLLKFLHHINFDSIHDTIPIIKLISKFHQSTYLFPSEEAYLTSSQF